MAELDNARHEIFAQGIASGLSQRAAYRAAFPKAEKWKDKTVDNRACELYNSGEILGRVQEIQQAASKSTIMDIIERKETLTEIARCKREKTKDRISAIDILNRMEGAYTDNLNLGGQVNNPFAGLSTEELKKLIDDG